MIYNLNNVVKNHNHTIITVILVTAGCIFGYGIETLLAVGGFWLGREHSQAEYRYMKLKGINRSKLDFFDGCNSLAWNYDSFVNDLVLPIAVGVLIVGVSYAYS